MQRAFPHGPVVLWAPLLGLLALTACASWRGVAPGVPSESAAAEAALAEGDELVRLGRFELAATQLAQAAAGFEASGREREALAARLRLAEAQQALGRYGDSLHTLARAGALAEAGGEGVGRARVHAAAGNAYSALGPPEQARRELEQGLALARGADAPALSAAILNDLGNWHAGREELEAALSAYRESEALARGAQRAGLAARALANAGRLAVRAGRPAAETRALLDAAWKLAQDLPASHDTAYLWISLGRSYARLAAAEDVAAPSASERAHETLLRAAELADSLGDRRAASFAWGYLAQLYETQGRADEALQLTSRALFAAQEAAAPESLYLWWWQAGRLHRALGQRERAVEAYGRAVDVLQSIRHQMAHSYGSGSTSFREAVGPVYFEYVDLLLAGPATADAAAEQARLRTARETVEGLKAAELRDYFRDECVDALQEKITSIDEVRGALVVYPVLLADRTDLLITLAGGLRRLSVPVGAERLTAEVRTLRRLLEKRTTREYLPHAQQLYDWLVRPYEEELGRVETLVVVPDGPLRTIPMAALHDGSQFLIEKVAVASTPGLGLTDPRPLERRGLKLFMSGISQPVQGFAGLEHVPRELEAIHALYGGEVLLDEAFQVGRMETTLTDQNFSIVHIASHGEFSDDVASSFVLAYDGKLTLDRLAESVERTKFRDTPIELLTLSACETAAGNDRAALGLAGVAIKAGARSALGTLWKVNDVAAADLVVEFYRQLRDEQASKGVALQRAQRKLLADPRYKHPGYWSAFLLISNWL